MARIGFMQPMLSLKKEKPLIKSGWSRSGLKSGLKMLMQISNGILRKALIATAALLCCAYLIQLILMLNELRNWAEPKSGFAVDAPHLHTVEFYHALSLILLLAIVLAKKYYWAFGISIGYFILDMQRTFRTPAMFAGIFTLGVLGFAINFLFLQAESYVLRWRGPEAAA